MEKTNVTECISVYSFIEEKSIFPFNITVIEKNDIAILIDPGYVRFSEKVKKELEERNVKIEAILISHHHEDHFAGCEIFTDTATYAGEGFKYDYQEHLEYNSFLKNFRPKFVFNETQELQIENIRIKVIKTPGHNKCGYSFLIDDSILFVGDLIIYDTNNKPSLPYLDDHSTVDEHIKSLEVLKNLKPEVLLVGHGKPITNKNDIQEEIDDRLYYLSKLKINSFDDDIDDFLLTTKEDYCGLNFHEMNIKKLPA